MLAAPNPTMMTSDSTRSTKSYSQFRRRLAMPHIVCPTGQRAPNSKIQVSAPVARSGGRSRSSIALRRRCASRRGSFSRRGSVSLPHEASANYVRSAPRKAGLCMCCTDPISSVGTELGYTLMQQRLIALCQTCTDVGLVHEQDDIDESLDRVLATLKRLGMDPNHPLESRPLPVVATPISKINASSRMMQDQVAHGVNCDDRNQLLGRTDVVALRSKTKRTPIIRHVHIGSKLPWFVFESTLAHELTHVYIWIYRTSRDLPLLTAEKEEQICDSVAIWYLHRVLKTGGLTSTERHLIRHRQRVLRSRWNNPFIEEQAEAMASMRTRWTTQWLDRFIGRGDVEVVKISHWSPAKQKLVLNTVEEGDRKRSLISKLEPDQRTRRRASGLGRRI